MPRAANWRRVQPLFMPSRVGLRTTTFRTRLFQVLASLLLALSPAVALSRNAPLVFAASSLQESLTAAGQAWAARGHPRPSISFAASSALARQIEAGAPADLFISADEEWMNEVQARGLIRTETRRPFLGNRLVLIAPASSPYRVTIRPGFPLAAALQGGRLAIGDSSVPAGKYAEAALRSLGVWESVKARLAPAENVRAALAFVERGETSLGIVYATDALASRGVRVVGVFPLTSHRPISYPLAMLRRSTNPDAEGFRRFLLSPAGLAVFRQFGFTTR